MKKFVPMLLSGSVMASFAGCSTETGPVSVENSPSPAAVPSSAVVPETPAAPSVTDGVLVSLSVPNMV